MQVCHRALPSCVTKYEQFKGCVRLVNILPQHLMTVHSMNGSNPTDASGV